MIRNTSNVVSRKALVVLAVFMLVVGSSAPLVLGQESGGMGVSISPDDPSAENPTVGETRQYAVMVDGVANVGAASADISLSDPSVATITDISLVGTSVESNSLADASVASDGSSASFATAYGRNPIESDGSAMAIAVVTVEMTGAGSTDIDPSNVVIGSADGSSYDVASVSGVTVTTEAASTPEETPDETPEETPDETPEETPEETPDETPEETPDETPEENTGEDQYEAPAYYQVDFVVGEPLQTLGSADSDHFYSDQERLVGYLHGTSDDPVTRQGSPPTLAHDYTECVSDVSMTVEDGHATVTFTVEDGCEETFSLVSYEKPGLGFDRDRAHEQVLVDSSTGTYGSGTYTLTVDLPEASDN